MYFGRLPLSFLPRLLFSSFNKLLQKLNHLRLLLPTLMGPDKHYQPISHCSHPADRPACRSHFLKSDTWLKTQSMVTSWQHCIQLPFFGIQGLCHFCLLFCYPVTCNFQRNYQKTQSNSSHSAPTYLCGSGMCFPKQRLLSIFYQSKSDS